MRKKYIKPNLMVESFTLTQSIAVNCGTAYAGADKASDVGTPLLHDYSSCAFDFGSLGDTIFFLTENEACNDEGGIPVENWQEFEEYLGAAYCYQAPSEDTAVFDS